MKIDTKKCNLRITTKTGEIVVPFTGSNRVVQLLWPTGLFGIGNYQPYGSVMGAYTAEFAASRFLQSMAAGNMAIIEGKMVKFEDVVSAEITDIQPNLVEVTEEKWHGMD
jgi:hypothetical protein